MKFRVNRVRSRATVRRVRCTRVASGYTRRRTWSLPSGTAARCEGDRSNRRALTLCAGSYHLCTANQIAASVIQITWLTGHRTKRGNYKPRIYPRQIFEPAWKVLGLPHASTVVAVTPIRTTNAYRRADRAVPSLTRRRRRFKSLPVTIISPRGRSEADRLYL